MAAISFKSVGDLKSNPRSVQTPQPKPVGILTPVRPNIKSGGPFEMSTSAIDQMVDNFKNMLLINHGERVPFYDFGGNLRFLLTERLSQPDYNEQAMMFIRATTEKYMPYISLSSFDAQPLESEKTGTSRMRILVEFSIPRLSTSVKTVEIILTNIG